MFSSTDEAIEALLNDAHRALDEQRPEDAELVFAFIRKLVERAMSELEDAGAIWETPGSRPEWPPLAELERNLDKFRKRVIPEGRRELISALHSLDLWLLREGVRRRCGEMFTVALEGREANYALASRAGKVEVRKGLRDFFWSDFLLIKDFDTMTSQEFFSYTKYAIRHQERLLALAMHTRHAVDFKAMSEEFTGVLQAFEWKWGAGKRLPGSAELHEELQQRYRIALMGLGGRALLLASADMPEDRLDDPQAYLDVVRTVHSNPQRLAKDIGQALVFEKSLEEEASLWFEWETRGTPSLVVQTVTPERYPLAFFSMRLLELARDPMPPLDLHGKAPKLRDWISEDVGQVARFVRLSPEESLEEQRQRARAAISAAARRHKDAADTDIIGRPLSAERVSKFVADVYERIVSNSVTERLFADAGAYLYLAHGDAAAPRMRGLPGFLVKAAFTDQPSEGPFSDVYVTEHTMPPYGAEVESDVMRQFSAALDDTPVIEAPLDTPEALLRAIDQALDALASPGEAIVLLTGDWNESSLSLATEPPTGYEPWDSEGLPRYRGYPILYPINPPSGDRGVYVVEPREWGCFVRAQLEDGIDLRVKIKPISAKRAEEILDKNSKLFPDETDATAKLRKVQMLVECTIAWSIGFRVTSPERARLVTESRPGHS